MGHFFKKQFGQNFLRGDRYARLLVDALELKPNEPVIEIGPGDGRVTALLLETGAKVTSVEIDYDLIPPLIKRFGSDTQFELLHQDILSLDVSALPQGYKMAGSLPYNISKQIIYKFSTCENPPAKMSFIVQEEVAQEYVAQAPQASFLSTTLRLYAHVRKLETIPATQFHPQPKVNGAILAITPTTSLDPDKRTRLHKLVTVAFRSPRKTLRNNLQAANRWDTPDIDTAIEELALSRTVRPAELTSENWEMLQTKLG